MRYARVVRSSFVALRPARAVLLGALALSGALLAGGCARNAALEIELTVPARPAGSPELYVVAMFLTGDFDFSSVAVDPEYPGTALTDGSQQLRYSVITERPDGHVRMVVFFCESTTCRDEDPSTIPQAWFDFERGTYIGQRTRWSGEILAVPTTRPTAPTCVDRCEVEGCIEGQGWFCRDDGSHYCQDRGADPGEEVCDP